MSGTARPGKSARMAAVVCAPRGVSLMKRLFATTALAVTLAAAIVVGAGQAPGAGADRLTADVFKGLELRSHGPGFATGRIADVAIDPKNPSVYYVASAFGGLWKSVN